MIGVNRDVKNDTVVVGVGVMAMPAPGLRGQMDFDITGIEPAADLYARTGEIGAAVPVRNARREYPDAQTV
jgi:hypothetical protein